MPRQIDHRMLGIIQPIGIAWHASPRDHEETSDPHPIGKEPRLHLMHRNPKTHHRGDLRQPYIAQQWRAFGIVVKID